MKNPLRSGLNALLKKAIARGVSEEELRAQRRSWILAEAAFGSDVDEASYKKALQRNDLAEIARLDDEATKRSQRALKSMDRDPSDERRLLELRGWLQKEESWAAGNLHSSDLSFVIRLLDQERSRQKLGEIDWVAAQQRARDAYRDDTKSERDCDKCGKPYRGPSVYCSIECALADA